MANVLLGVTGSVAAKLTPKLVSALLENGHNLKIIVTEKAVFFWKPRNLVYGITTYRDSDEWKESDYIEGSSVLHIDLRNWADLLLIAPLSANTLAKIANGLADNLLTSVVRAWNTKKPLIVAPAMNTLMWEHPVTVEHLRTLIRWHEKFHIIMPVEKKLACGDTGMGAMAQIETIKETVKCVH